MPVAGSADYYTTLESAILAPNSKYVDLSPAGGGKDCRTIIYDCGLQVPLSMWTGSTTSLESMLYDRSAVTGDPGYECSWQVHWGSTATATTISYVLSVEV